MATAQQPSRFQKASREAAKLKIGIQGPSGSGKSLGALALAKALSPDGRFAVLDTENGSASLYADRFDFDTLTLDPPYTSRRYIDAIHEAEEAGYHVLVIDSLSHQWAGEGGILSRKEQVDARGGNHFSNWAPFTKEHEEFKAAINNAGIHLIATLRTKQDYVLEEGKNGKQTPKKVGTAPIQREGMEYELSLVFELQMDHKAAASKDRTSLFDDKLSDLTDGKVAKALTNWLAGGVTPTPRPRLVTEVAAPAAPPTDPEDTPFPNVPGFEGLAGTVMRSLTSAQLANVWKTQTAKGKSPKLCAFISARIDARGDAALLATVEEDEKGADPIVPGDSDSSPEPLPSSNDEPAAVETMSMDDAKKVKIPGDDKAFGGNGGQKLGAVSLNLVRSLHKWIAGDESRMARYVTAHEACGVLIAAAEQDQESFTLESEPVAEAVAPALAPEKKSTIGGRKLRGGKVADALQSNADDPKSVFALTKKGNELARHVAIDKATKDSWKKLVTQGAPATSLESTIRLFETRIQNYQAPEASSPNFNEDF